MKLRYTLGLFLTVALETVQNAKGLILPPDMVLMGYLESTSTGIVRLTRQLEGSPASKARKEHFEAFIKRMELNGRLGGPQFNLPIKGSDWNEFWEQIQRDEAAGASQAASSAEGNAADEGSSNASQQPKSSSRSKLKSFLRNLF